MPAGLNKATGLALGIVGAVVAFVLAMALWSGTLDTILNHTSNVTDALETGDTGNDTINSILGPLSMLPAAAVPLAVVGSIVSVVTLLRVS